MYQHEGANKHMIIAGAPQQQINSITGGFTTIFSTKSTVYMNPHMVIYLFH